MIYYYLNNDKLKAMFATAGGKRITVKEFYDMDFPSEFLNDPSATNIDLQLTEAMLDMIRKNDIKSKAAKFVLENNKIPFREMILPYAKPSILYPIISAELFTDKKLAESHTVDFVEIDRNIEDPDEEMQEAALNSPEETEEEQEEKSEKKKKAKKARLMITYIDNLVIENLKKVLPRSRHETHGNRYFAKRAVETRRFYERRPAAIFRACRLSHDDDYVVSFRGLQARLLAVETHLFDAQRKLCERNGVFHQRLFRHRERGDSVLPLEIYRLQIRRRVYHGRP